MSTHDDDLSWSCMMFNLIIERKAREMMYLVASVRLSVCPSVHSSDLSRLNRLTYDLDFRSWGLPWPWLGWDCRSRSWVKIQGQKLKIVFWPHCCLALRSKVRIEVKGRGQGHGSRSRSRSNFWCIAVDIRALPSVANSKEESFSVKGVCLCVELSCGCDRSAFN